MSAPLAVSQYTARVFGANTNYTCPSNRRARYHYCAIGNVYWWNDTITIKGTEKNGKLNGYIDLKPGDVVSIARTTPVATGLAVSQLRAAIVQISVNGVVVIDLQEYVFVRCDAGNLGNVNGLTICRYLVEEFNL